MQIKTLAVLSLVAFSSFVKADCNSPECVAAEYMSAHISQDVEKVYDLTATSQRGDLDNFLSAYYDRHHSPSIFRDYWKENVSFDIELLQEGDKVSRVVATTTFPDWSSVAMDRALQGHGLSSNEDWQLLIDSLESEGVEYITEKEDIDLIKTEGNWRVFRPTLH